MESSDPPRSNAGSRPSRRESSWIPSSGHDSPRRVADHGRTEERPIAVWRYAPPLALLGLALAIYGPHLVDGPVSDDFLYLHWLRLGPGVLLDRLTLASDPQMLRPLAAVGWLLTGLPGSLAWIHLLSIVLHTAVGMQVSAIGRILGASRGAALFAAALFVASPLLSEPVVWASSHTDPLAALLGLGALRLALLRRGIGWCSLLMVLALAAKESVAGLPLAVLALASGDARATRGRAECPQDRRATAPGTRKWGLETRGTPRRGGSLAAGFRHLAWPAALALLPAVVAVALLRLAAFGSLGGYADSLGQRSALGVDFSQLARAVLVQIPHRVLDLTRASISPAPTLIAVAHGALLVLTALRALAPARFGLVLRAVLAAGLALTPAAAVFGIDPDLQGARMLYLPLAVLAAGLAPALDLGRRGASLALGLLLAVWTIAAIANASAWRAAAQTVEGVLPAVAKHARTLPPDSALFVDAPPSIDGAFALHNAVAAGARRHGAREDLLLVLGQPSLLAHRRSLGRSVFAIRVDHEGRLVEWTDCARALLLGAPAVRESRPVQAEHVELPPGTFAVRIVLDRVTDEALGVELFGLGPPIGGRIFPDRRETVVVATRPLARETPVHLLVRPPKAQVVAVEILATPQVCAELESAIATMPPP